MAQSSRASPQQGRHDSPFFRSKFRVPSVPSHFVPRVRLLQLIDDLAEYPVTALVAPAGSGKTVLAADWVRQRGGRTEWLTLDGSDGDGLQFLTALATALDPLAPGCAEATVAALRGHDPVSRALHVLVEALELAEGPPAVLVVDDVHHVDEEPTARAVLEAFVEHRPAWLSLLLVSRRSLSLSVERLRAAGSLAEVTFEALRFSDDEALSMLAGLCPDIPAEELSPVAEWGDGWAAALQLAALAVRSRRGALVQQGDEAAPPVGSGRLVDEYLWREVLRAERPELINLLLGVSVVDRVNYPLAEALTDRTDAGDILAEAERRGVFVTGLESGGWFEVHGLVRDVLLAELERRWPDRLREQHVRAARWFEMADDSASALEHWLAAEMPRQALRLLADLAVDLADSGQEAAVRRILDEIIPRLHEPDAEAWIELAWCQLLVDASAFGTALAAAESAAGSASGPLAGRLMILRAAGALLAGDWRTCEAHARAALEAMGESAAADVLGRSGWGLVGHGIALDERWSEDEPEVARVTLGVSNDAQRAVALEGTRALGLALAGHPVDAVRKVAAVRHAVDEAGITRVRNQLVLAEAVATRELGDRPQAEELLTHVAGLSCYPDLFVPFLARLELVGLHLSEGDLDRAEAAFRLAEAAPGHDHDGPGAGRLARHGVLLALARRDLDAAGRWAERVDDPLWGPVCDTRVLLARHQEAQALDRLDLADPRCERHRVTLHLLRARALREGDRGTATKEVARAVEIAADRGMLETVGAEGRQLLDLLELSAWWVPEAWMQRLRRVVVGSEDVREAPDALVDELTARERDVLRLLPTRLSLGEVAEELYVSYNTLKFHLRVIYHKLGVNSRAEAVDRARRLGLLRRS